MADYPFGDIEKKWQDYWAKNQVYKTSETSGKPPYYILDMFPYPSGAGLHVGHPLGYIASDIIARFKRHKQFEVLHPMGFDAFGLPAEQFAIDTGNHPGDFTDKNIERYRQQLRMIGLSYDWSREVKTSDPKFYKWTQWIFIQLFNSWYDTEADKAEDIDGLIKIFEKEGNSNVKAHSSPTAIFSGAEWNKMTEPEQQKMLLNYRLAYIADSEVNWCEALGTVLANEEIKDGFSERGGYPVVKKKMRQWFLRITAYADKLLQGLNEIEWPEAVKEMQRNWIGKSIGAEVEFYLAKVPSPHPIPAFPKGEGGNPIPGPSPMGKGAVRPIQASALGVGSKVPPSGGFRGVSAGASIRIFTTRPDTIFGCSFMVLAPEHPLVNEITTSENREEVKAYVEAASRKSDRERMAEVKKISGVFTGAYAINPFTEENIPVWVADYVLGDYGTGAIMAVPAHDSRDWAFANAKLGEKYIRSIIAGIDVSEASHDAKEGKLINSGFLNGLDVKDAISKAINEIEKRGIGRKQINYRLRDANFSRQRYWGEPFPVYFKGETPYVVDEKHLPIELPEVESYKPTGNGESPLATVNVNEWKPWDKILPEGAKPETNTMPGWAGSSWYFLRYMDPFNDKEFVSKEREEYWKSVDFYIGGAEHATGHLLYSRFWNRFLYDKGLALTQEPFKKMINQGMIQGVSQLITICKLQDEDGLVCCSFTLVQGNYIQFNNINHRVSAWSEDRIPINYVDFKGRLYKDKFIELTKTPKYEDLANLTVIWENDENNQSFILLKPEVEKMSKSKGNVVNPDEIIEKYGCDTFRMYEMFLGPVEQSKPWDTKGIEGVSRFLRKFWGLFDLTPSPSPKERGASPEPNFVVGAEVKDISLKGEPVEVPKVPPLGGFRGVVSPFGGDLEGVPTPAELKALHRAIKKVTDDIERFNLNTCISSFMICVNELAVLKCNKRAILEPLVILISPFAPHIAEELWNKLGHTTSIAREPYPVYEEKYLVESSFEYPVSVNGKTRTKIELPLDMPKEEVEKQIHALDLLKWTEGKPLKKVIVVPGKIVNVVV